MVLIVHIGQMIPGLNKYTSIGSNGVQLFFVLSGYLTFKSLENSDTSLIFYKKRIVHIIPVYYSGLILLYIVDFIMYSRTMSIFECLAGPCGYQFLRYFAFLNVIIPSNDWGLWNNRSGLWTMSTFFVFLFISAFDKQIH